MRINIQLTEVTIAALNGLGYSLYGMQAFKTTNLSGKRIKSLCGAKPPHKLGWTNAGRWGADGAMEISPRTLFVRSDDCRSEGAT